MELKAVLGFVKFGAASLLLSESGLALCLCARRAPKGSNKAKVFTGSLLPVTPVYHCCYKGTASRPLTEGGALHAHRWLYRGRAGDWTEWRRREPARRFSSQTADKPLHKLTDYCPTVVCVCVCVCVCGAGVLTHFIAF